MNVIEAIDATEDLDPVSKLVVARDLVRQIIVECPPNSDLDKAAQAAKTNIEIAWAFVESDTHSIAQGEGSETDGWRDQC